MLSASNISKTYTTRTLFSGLTLNVSDGDRMALIGPNGSGKTTLLDILAGDISPDTGGISKQRNVSIGYLRQEPAAFSGKTLLQEVLDDSFVAAYAVAGTVEQCLEQCRDLAATGVTQMTVTFHGEAPEASMARFGDAARS